MSMHQNFSSTFSSSSSTQTQTQSLSVEGSRLKHGHILLGLAFIIIGLWHFYNQVKINKTHKTFKSLIWFPIKFSRYMEPYLILISSSIYTLMELHFAPFDRDGTFNSNHIHHIEHACIAMAFILHALFAILLDKIKLNNNNNNGFSNVCPVGHLLAAVAFAQELLLLHFHTTDHFGLEGQYHVLLQLLAFVCLVSCLLGIWLPKSFMVSYIRSSGIIFQGVWLVTIGLMLWTPEFAPKGCFQQKDERGRNAINCNDEQSLHRAKALVTILFSWLFSGIMGLGVVFYWVISKVYEVNELIINDLEEGDCYIEDIQGFLQKKRVVKPFDLE